MPTNRQKIRWLAIAAIILGHGGVTPSTQELADHFGIRPETIRRDLGPVHEIIRSMPMVMINTVPARTKKIKKLEEIEVKEETKSPFVV